MAHLQEEQSTTTMSLALVGDTTIAGVIVRPSSIDNRMVELEAIIAKEEIEEENRALFNKEWDDFVVPVDKHPSKVEINEEHNKEWKWDTPCPTPPRTCDSRMLVGILKSSGCDNDIAPKGLYRTDGPATPPLPDHSPVISPVSSPEQFVRCSARNNDCLTERRLKQVRYHIVLLKAELGK